VALAPHALAYSFRTRVRLLGSLPFSPVASAAAEHAPASATARTSSSPELAVLATTTHRQLLHLAPSIASLKGSRCPRGGWIRLL
jgi:hypothetical protein